MQVDLKDKQLEMAQAYIYKIVMAICGLGN